MTRLEKDFLYLILLLSNKKTSKGIFPHKKTIINILRGNNRSVNAMKFKETELFGKYSFFNSSSFDSFISKYNKDYIREYRKNDKIRYYANKNLKQHFESLPQFAKPSTSHILNDDEINEVIDSFVK